MAAYKEQKKKVKEHNKALKAEYEKALEEAPESVKAFIQEPEYLPEPEKPKEPIMPEYSKGYSLNMDRQDRSYGWKLLSRFEFFKIEGSDFGYLRKRPEMLKFSARTATEVAKIGEMTKGEFLEEIRRLDVDTRLPPLAPIKPMHAASMLAGGIGEFSKEIDLGGEQNLIKAAIVKEFSTRKILMGSKEIEETVEFYEQKMGVYNLDRRELRVLG